MLFVAKFQMNILGALPLAPTVSRSRPSALSCAPLLASNAELSLLTETPSQRFWVSPLVIDQREFHSPARSYSTEIWVFLVNLPTTLIVQACLSLSVLSW